MWVRNKSQNLIFWKLVASVFFFPKCYLLPPQKTEANLTIEEHIQTTGRIRAMVSFGANMIRVLISESSELLESGQDEVDRS